jgi:hypothetical protein
MNKTKVAQAKIAADHPTKDRAWRKHAERLAAMGPLEIACMVAHHEDEDVPLPAAMAYALALDLGNLRHLLDANVHVAGSVLARLEKRAIAIAEICSDASDEEPAVKA